MDFGDAFPGEAFAADADAILQRQTVALDQIEVARGRIDNDRARLFARRELDLLARAPGGRGGPVVGWRIIGGAIRAHPLRRAGIGAPVRRHIGVRRFGLRLTIILVRLAAAGIRRIGRVRGAA